MVREECSQSAQMTLKDKIETMRATGNNVVT